MKNARISLDYEFFFSHKNFASLFSESHCAKLTGRTRRIVTVIVITVPSIMTGLTEISRVVIGSMNAVTPAVPYDRRDVMPHNLISTQMKWQGMVLIVV